MNHLQGDLKLGSNQGSYNGSRGRKKNRKYRVSQKKVWFVAPDTKLYLFFEQLYCMVFFQYFFNVFIFFGTSMARKKIREHFFLSKSKVQKNKNVLINCFYPNLKFYKDWITESQKICKIVIRKFAIFSSVIIFTENFFSLVLKVSTEQRILNTLEWLRRKELENLNNFSVKIIPELKLRIF